jgi:uncharacterized membrane protein YfcA
MEFSNDILAILFLVAILAGTIDTIAGGGGLITIPALLSVGIPPLATLSTNKLQSVFGTFTASLYFIRKKLVDIKEIKLMIFMAFFGSILGGLVLTQIDSSILSKIIPILLIFMGVYFLFTKNIGTIEKHKIISFTIFAFTLVFIIGFYDGFFGPGTGSFFTLSFIYFLGYNISKATAQTKILNFATNFGSLIFFSFYGDIFLLVGLIMGMGQVIGSLIGAKLVVTKGQKLIRPLIVFISFSMSIKLLLF